MKRTVAVLIAWSCFVLNVSADWPAWRGPTGQGYSSEQNLPTSWSSTENVKWKVKLEYPGNSTPIIWKDKILVHPTHAC